MFSCLSPLARTRASEVPRLYDGVHHKESGFGSTPILVALAINSSSKHLQLFFRTGEQPNSDFSMTPSVMLAVSTNTCNPSVFSAPLCVEGSKQKFRQCHRQNRWFNAALTYALRTADLRNEGFQNCNTSVVFHFV